MGRLCFADRARGFASSRAVASVAAMAAVLVAAPAWGAGFGFFEQGAKAMGMGGAFTAQADDPSALFHNVGGLAFLRERDVYLGSTFTAIGDAQFQGLAPFPGEGATGEQEDQILFPSHLYYVQPVSRNWSFGIGVNNPFGLVTEWSDPDAWAGRFLSTRAELRTFDVNPSLGWQATPKVGFGFGLVARFSDVELDRRVGIVNPFTFQGTEVAKVNLQSDLDEGFGWNVGLLHRYNNSFSWGFSYRSKVEVDYGGDARFTQVLTGNPQLDALVAARFPFGENVPLATSVEFPDMASLGVALALSPDTLLEVDVNWTGWSSFDQVILDFPDESGLPDDVLPENWEDVYNYRVGLRWQAGSRSEWRVGYIYDETPQPEETVSPLLPDANRNDYTLGYGYRSDGGFRFDLAFMLVEFDDRTTRTNVDDFLGTYESTAYLLGLSLGF